MDNAITGIMEDWKSAGLAHARLRSYFWFGTKVNDPKNHVLSECDIAPDGSFRMVLPEVPREKASPMETLVPRSPSVSVSDYDAMVSNCIEFSIFDAMQRYRYMAYFTNILPGSTQLPVGSYYVYYRFATRKVRIHGLNPITETKIYDPSGKLIDMTRIINYRYDDITMEKGWNIWALKLAGMESTPARIVMDYDVLAVAPRDAKWRFFHRPDLE
jgi:hypothetical protein